MWQHVIANRSIRNLNKENFIADVVNLAMEYIKKGGSNYESYTNRQCHLDAGFR